MRHRGPRRHPRVMGDSRGKGSWSCGWLCLARHSTARAMTTQGVYELSCQMGESPWRDDESTRKELDSRTLKQTMKMRCTAVSSQ